MPKAEQSTLFQCFTPHSSSLTASLPPFLSALKTCEFIRPKIALTYSAFACTTLYSYYLCHSLCINLTNAISAFHSGQGPANDAN